VALRRGAAVAGRVVDAGGAPVEGARVVAIDVGQPWLEPDAEREGVRTGADGRFELPAVAAGTYRFSAVHREHAPGATAPTTLDGATAKRDVEIRLAAGAVLAGTVVDRAKAPVPYATVRVAPKEAGMGIRGDARQVTADAAGAFEIRGLTRAALRVRAESEQAASAIVDVDLGAAAEKKDLVLVLDVTGAIAGVVVDSAGAPLGDVQVTAMTDVAASRTWSWRASRPRPPTATGASRCAAWPTAPTGCARSGAAAASSSGAAARAPRRGPATSRCASSCPRPAASAAASRSPAAARRRAAR
jgi:hypothetical protein